MDQLIIHDRIYMPAYMPTYMINALLAGVARTVLPADTLHFGEQGRDDTKLVSVSVSDLQFLMREAFEAGRHSR